MAETSARYRTAGQAQSTPSSKTSRLPGRSRPPTPGVFGGMTRALEAGINISLVYVLRRAPTSSEPARFQYGNASHGGTLILTYDRSGSMGERGAFNTGEFCDNRLHARWGWGDQLRKEVKNLSQ